VTEQELVDAVAESVAERIQGAPTQLIDAAGAAALLGVPESWIRAEARADRIPHVRLGKYVRFDPAELEAWWSTSRRRGPRPRKEPAK
jgi:excisionase family DNA binding protein